MPFALVANDSPKFFSACRLSWLSESEVLFPLDCFVIGFLTALVPLRATIAPKPKAEAS